jgi:hypothetical protein
VTKGPTGALERKPFEVRHEWTERQWFLVSSALPPRPLLLSCPATHLNTPGCSDFLPPTSTPHPSLHHGMRRLLRHCPWCLLPHPHPPANTSCLSLPAITGLPHPFLTHPH